jgi:hypothetical protein
MNSTRAGVALECPPRETVPARLAETVLGPALLPLKGPDVSICAAAKMLSPPPTDRVRENTVKHIFSTSKVLVLQMPISAWTHPHRSHSTPAGCPASSPLHSLWCH